MWGVGHRTTEVLEKLGIHTIGALAQTNESLLKKWFGKNGALLVRMARGEIDSPVRPPSELPPEKSIGHEHTFGRDTNDWPYIESELLLLSQLVGRRMRRQGVLGRRITLKYRYENFETHTHQLTLSYPTYLDDVIFESAKRLFREKFDPRRKIRLLGISVSRLEENSAGVRSTLSLFFDPSLQKKEKLFPVLDRLMDLYGEGIVWRASSLNLF
jgi:DNA polymerase-4